ncbi:MAG: porin [Pseudomonadota bacterium]|nr:porin [Pseudomonadota bacterium]
MLSATVSAAALAENSAAPAADDNLTWHGITLYGIVDIGLQYENHGAPFSDFHPAGSANIVQKNSRQSVLGATPSNMSQSRIGLQGVESVGGDWSAVFKLETFFNPQSGQISDASKSMTQNNGKTPATQTTNLNSSVAGQAFQTAYVGMSSKTFGTVTFGRQLTLVADGVNKYDPNYGSQAFSLVGMSGPYAGAGDTEDKRLDSSLKYVASYHQIGHFGALYKFNGATGGANSAFQVDIGGEYAGLSVDAYFSKVKSAVSSAPLTAAQVALLPGLGFSADKSLAGTISDNTTWSLMSSYNLGAATLFASYEHMKYENPANPLPAGFDDIGGYKLAFVTNNAYIDPKVLRVYWGGVRYTVLPGLDLTAAAYGVHQNAYGTGAAAGCSTSAHAQCSGWLQAYSFDADYRLTKRFDAYAGLMYSSVHDGFANGYAFQTNNMNPTIGVRYKY